MKLKGWKNKLEIKQDYKVLSFTYKNKDASFATVTLVTGLILLNGFLWIFGLIWISLKKKTLVTGLRVE